MTDAHARNLELQLQWYGEPLGDRFRRLLARLGLSQAQLAGVLGLSAPMLSQLMSGQRAKISNPTVLSRLLQLEAMVGESGWDALPAAEQERRLEGIRAAQRSTLTVDQGSPAEPPAAGDPVVAIQSLLRDVASASDLQGAAELLEAQYPDLAEALRVLGAGRTQEARAYYARVTANR
ncbi:helix-turn-helix protein [Kribbella orskensis]|uniref:Helix-turn-helix protein n=1 Tax=Kribbella orskensis TaxID=2512216 RepID=A0ABY2BEA6_9ACTN|nr:MULTISPECIES: helix-turn-helix transcriptional regulator [Kribbella]TCN36559.1 helix-turn-helix protein [Kribbella sp. VKM Ac-2500]TCO17798.1 helix-turn-helix protein [Kribbella orskensis]